MLNWSSISMWLTSCHNPQEGLWASWSNVHYPSSSMAALGCLSQMKPSASSICTHFVHYCWAKNNPSLHLLPSAQNLLQHHVLQLLLVLTWRQVCIFIQTIKSLCPTMLSQNSPSGPIVCVTESVCSLVSCVFQHLNKNRDCIISQLIKQPSPLHQSASLHVNVCVFIY